ncbi:MAG: NAD(P)/FAD-dependent oxidoreductase [Candidatus Hodarchaeota archaeon]
MILGNGVAGSTVANTLRRQDAGVEIEVYTDEPYGYYSRIWLPEIISEEKSVDEVISRKKEWYDERNIALYTNTKVVKIDPEGKKIFLENGESKNYDILCLCLGAHSWVPPINNAAIKGVFTLRTIDDALAIKEYIKNKEKAICIGGGLLGLEAARNLKRAGLDVTVVEYFPRLLPRQLCDDSSMIFREKIHQLGLKTILGASVSEILGEGVVSGVKLTNGDELNADVVLVSAGIRSNLDLVKDTGLEINKCLVVNDCMQTSHPDIYAAGDVSEFQGKSWGIIPAALEQANIAAMNILGAKCKPYTPTIPSNTLKILDFDLMSTGKAILDDDDEADCKVFISKDALKGVYKKFVVKDKKLVGAILIESKDDQKFVRANMNKEITEEEIKEHLEIK